MDRYIQMIEQNTNRIIEASEEAVNCFQENGFFFLLLQGGEKWRLSDLFIS